MDEKKPPADILEEIMSRSEKPLPSPVPYPPKFDPPPPEDTPPPSPAAEKPLLAERLLPWLCALLGGAVLAALVLGFQLFSVNARLDTLTASVGEIQTVDELRKENEKLRKENGELKEQVDTQRDEAYVEPALEDVLRAQRAEYRMRQSEYLYYMERFVAQGDLTMAALVMTLEDDVLRPAGEDEPERLVYGGAMVPPLDSIHQIRYDEIQQRLVAEGVLDLDGHAPLWPDGTGPSEDFNTAALGILWCALDAHLVQGNDHAAAQYLYYYLQEGPMGYQPRMEKRAGDFALGQYELMRDELVEEQWLTVTEADGRLALGYGPTGSAADLLYGLPFDLPPIP